MKVKDTLLNNIIVSSRKALVSLKADGLSGAPNEQ